MELVAAAKMRRAQAQALATRTYAQLAWELVRNLSDKTDPRIHKLLKKPVVIKNIAIILITSNRGLIGGFNNNLVNTAVSYARGFDNVEFITLGKKGRQAVKKFGYSIAADFEKLDAVSNVKEIAPLTHLVVQDFIMGKFDEVTLVYMDFVSTLQQRPRVKRLLPIFSPHLSSPASGEELKEGGDKEGTEYLFEPSPDQVLEVLLPRLVEMQVYQALLEANASEHSARMVAMKNASDAASDLTDELTLEFNQLRQAGITKEISEIVAGKLALNQ